MIWKKLSSAFGGVIEKTPSIKFLANQIELKANFSSQSIYSVKFAKLMWLKNQVKRMAHFLIQTIIIIIQFILGSEHASIQTAQLKLKTFFGNCMNQMFWNE